MSPFGLFIGIWNTTGEVLATATNSAGQLVATKRRGALGKSTMRTRTSASSIAILALLTFGQQAHASPQALDIVSIALGQPFPIQPMVERPAQTSGLGFYVFDAPNHLDSKIPFVQYQVAILEQSQLVYYVRGTRPYLKLTECRQQMDAIVPLVKALSGMQPKVESFARFEGRRGDVEIVVACSGQTGSPYVDLEFTRRSIPAREKLKASWK